MSFHGGLIGAVLAALYFGRKKKIGFFQIADLITPAAPIGLGLGRLGNFINGELYGRVTDVPWGISFPSGGPLPRHPSQLYERLEGRYFFILWLVRARRRPPVWCSGCSSLYGLFQPLWSSSNRTSSSVTSSACSGPMRHTLFLFGTTMAVIF
jgi:phosphatidylglycerol:prolipoprotein diacylglycerol transferase